MAPSGNTVELIVSDTIGVGDDFGHSVSDANGNTVELLIGLTVGNDVGDDVGLTGVIFLRHSWGHS